jgi:protein tyrosine phosphatase (PTP) superfamily phosphohydrolase (DUF442 family)
MMNNESQQSPAESNCLSGQARHRMGRWLVPLLAGLIVVAGVVTWRNYFQTYHFAEVTHGVLYRNGNRAMREFKTAVREANVRTVVMLNDDGEVQREPFKSEVIFCQQRGINLVRIPVVVGQRPTTEDVRRFLDVMADAKNHPVLVHCAQGVRRTAMMVAAYQMSVLKYDAQRAKETILPWGRKSERLADIRAFIDDYDPEACSVGSAHLITLPQDADWHAWVIRARHQTGEEDRRWAWRNRCHLKVAWEPERDPGRRFAPNPAWRLGDSFLEGELSRSFLSLWLWQMEQPAIRVC